MSTPVALGGGRDITRFLAVLSHDGGCRPRRCRWSAST